MEDCLKDIIKLSRTECECFDTDKPINYNEGQSEVYLDELDGLNLKFINGASGCQNGSLWELMAWARDEAAKQFKADLLSCINKNYTSRRQIYSGLVTNQTNFTSSLSINKNKAGVLFSVPQIKGGEITIKRIGLAINITSAITVDVYSNEDVNNPIASYVINSDANSLTYGTLSTPLKLPLYSSSVSHLEYYFVYNRVGFQPKDIKADCGCGSKRPEWMQWLKINGIEGNGTDYTQFTRSNYVNGLILDVDLRCKTADLICSETRPLDFENDGFDMQIAYANRWLAGALLMQKMLDSPDLNRYTMMDRERVYGMRNHARKMYNDFVQYLCENREVSTGCLVCKPNPNFSMGNIIA